MTRAFKSEWRKRIEARCAGCEKPFMAVISEQKRGKGRTCSFACSASLAAAGRDQSGDKNPKWAGGLSNSDRKRRYRERHTDKHAAHGALTKALRMGDLRRLPCEVCGEMKVEGHHDDYSQPLAVRWLCKRHHLEAHGGRLNNGL